MPNCFNILIVLSQRATLPPVTLCVYTKLPCHTILPPSGSVT